VKNNTRMLAEGALCIALSLALSYFKIPTGISFGGFGGSIDLVMIPLIIFAYRWGLLWGLLSGFAFGTLKYFLAGGAAVNWVSMLLDYSVAYAFVGLAGLYKGTKKKNLPLAALAGCIGRFIIHFISGVTIYAEYMPEEFLGMTMPSPFVYSILYNGTYMLPNTVIAILVCILLIPVIDKLPKSR
ncbi:MAG: energy-coupled thiamine transporter ThiT, partial [Firmicutes bacterium]|nr:energy-coupled thiamine transporter ThiT [Bacillota bacterium]